MEGPVLILGGGINGSAIARELVLRRIPVTLVETRDLAYGATSRSSRLIHGGLRYLEYAEFSLVRESLNERTRLLRLAPHLVKPLRIHTPVGSRLSGWFQAIQRLLGFKVSQPKPRGLWLLRVGLWLYQKYAADPEARPIATNQVGVGEAPALNRALYRWVCSYDDGQVLYPERLVLEWLADASQFAQEEGVEFVVRTRCVPTRIGEKVELQDEASESDLDLQPSDALVRSLQPRLIINATGGWVDDTLQRLNVDSKRLMGGSKGSHLLMHNAALLDALGGDGIYAEAQDGRPVFILPMGELTLVGTTDIPYSEAPDQAIAELQEVEYLVSAVRRVLPNVQAEVDDVIAHYAGVRPLPRSDASTPGAVTRRHFLHSHENARPAVLSVIGGKLTTCRSLAQEVADWVLEHHGQGAQDCSTQSRPTPGGRDYPASDQLSQHWEAIASDLQIPLAVVQAVWSLYGARTSEVLTLVASYGPDANELLDEDVPLPLGLVRFVIEHEWARSLEDIVERRLMLVFNRRLKRSWLLRIEKQCKPGASDEDHRAAVERCVKRLQRYYGRIVEDDA